MQTPFKILQLKQKQKKKNITTLKQKHLFSTKFSKNGHKLMQYIIQKDEPQTLQNKCKANLKISSENQFRQNSDQKSKTSSQKYEILFRQSIRKVNAFRSKFNHENEALRKQNLSYRFITTPRDNQSSRSLKFAEEKFGSSVNDFQDKRVKTGSIEQKSQQINIGKHKILVKESPQKYYQNQIIPSISVQKCKLNLYNFQIKTKIQKPIRTFYTHNNNIEEIMRNYSLDSDFTKNDQNLQNPQINVSNSRLSKTLAPHNKKKSTRITTEVRISKKLTNQNFFGKSNEIQVGKITYENVANFIKTKKNKKIPIQTLRPDRNSNRQLFEFKRTSTGDFSNESRGMSSGQQLTFRYYSPNKKSKCGAKIKFNSIEENLSGWQFLPSENTAFNHQKLLRSPMMLDDF